MKVGIDGPGECANASLVTHDEIVRHAQSNEQLKHRMFQTRRMSVRRGVHLWSCSWRSIATQSRSSFDIDLDSTLPMEAHENASFGQFDWWPEHSQSLHLILHYAKSCRPFELFVNENYKL